MNAIRAPGVNFSALPAHLANRVVLESSSRAEAISRLRSLGVAAAVHILIADTTGATSLEASAVDLVKLEMKKGQIAHSNHFLATHSSDVRDAVFFPDSRLRMARMSDLLGTAATQLTDPTEAIAAVEKMLDDEDGFPTAINRKSSPGSPSSTLFSIVMNLDNKTAVVRLGRPTECEGRYFLKPKLAEI